MAISKTQSAIFNQIIACNTQFNDVLGNAVAFPDEADKEELDASYIGWKAQTDALINLLPKE